MRRLRTDQKRRMAKTVVTGPGILVSLNSPPYSKRTKELIELLRLLKKIEVVELHREPKRLGSQKRVERLSDTERDLYKSANRILSGCHWTPRVSANPDATHRFYWDARTEETDWENGFVHWLLGIRAAREICLIRNCRSCERWFYAITSHQVYCSDQCRQQFHAKSENFKERRRLYMRKFRQAEKLRDVRAKQLAQGKRRPL